MNNTETTFQGIAVSRGIEIGKILVHSHEKLKIDETPIGPETIDAEKLRFINGRREAKEQLEEIYQKALINLSEEEAEVFEGHIEILMDDEIEESVFEIIETELLCAEKAVQQVIQTNAEEMEALDNPYMQERAADIKDIGTRLLYAIAGVKLSSLDNLTEPVIIVAHELTPSDTAQMDITKVLGFATEAGGATSHVAIMAQSLELPAIVGVGTTLLQAAKTGMTAALDACKGTLTLSPTRETATAMETARKEFLEEKALLMELKELPAVTTDGHQIEVCANIGSEKDISSALENGAEGIGLFRTEFLYMDRPQLPTEEEQFLAYKAAAEGMQGKAVIIRTMDIGGDKELAYLDFPHEENPFLGWRAIRMCMDRPDILRVQLRAILRASAFGKLRIMYPMIISVEEIQTLNAILLSVKEELKAEGLAFDPAIEVGIMIETPAAGLIASDLIHEVDFFSIGTNDLTQYTLAVDRGNERIACLYNPLHPAVLRLIKQIIDASHAAGKWTGMCGELAGNEEAALILLGMGLDEFSMGAVNINRIKRLVRNTSYAEIQEFSAKVLRMRTVSEIQAAAAAKTREVLARL